MSRRFAHGLFYSYSFSFPNYFVNLFAEYRQWLLCRDRRYRTRLSYLFLYHKILGRDDPRSSQEPNVTSEITKCQLPNNHQLTGSRSLRLYVWGPVLGFLWKTVWSWLSGFTHKVQLPPPLPSIRSSMNLIALLSLVKADT